MRSWQNLTADWLLVMPWTVYQCGVTFITIKPNCLIVPTEFTVLMPIAKGLPPVSIKKLLRRLNSAWARSIINPTSMLIREMLMSKPLRYSVMVNIARAIGSSVVLLPTVVPIMMRKRISVSNP